MKINKSLILFCCGFLCHTIALATPQAKPTTSTVPTIDSAQLLFRTATQNTSPQNKRSEIQLSETKMKQFQVFEMAGKRDANLIICKIAPQEEAFALKEVARSYYTFFPRFDNALFDQGYDHGFKRTAFLTKNYSQFQQNDYCREIK